MSARPNNIAKLDPDVSLQLDSLRGFAAILVMITHGYQIFIAPVNNAVYPLFRLAGQAAVMIFFVLSGFLITRSILNNINKNHQFNLKLYYQNRLNRLLIPLYFSLVLVLILYLLSPYFFASGSHAFVGDQPFIIFKSFDFSWQAWFGSAFFVNGFLTPPLNSNAPLWSLAFEFWFYVLAGLVAFKQHRIGYPLFILLLVLLSLIHIEFLLFFAVWLSGASIALLHQKSTLLSYDTKNAQIIFYTLALLIIGYDLYQFYWLDSRLIYRTNLFTAFNLCFGFAFSATMVDMLQKKRSFPTQFAATARFSYSLYVIHFPILLFIFGIYPQSIQHGWSIALLFFFTSTLLCILISFLVAPWIEIKPFQHKNRLTKTN